MVYGAGDTHLVYVFSFVVLRAATWRGVVGCFFVCLSDCLCLVWLDSGWAASLVCWLLDCEENSMYFANVWMNCYWSAMLYDKMNLRIVWSIVYMVAFYVYSTSPSLTSVRPNHTSSSSSSVFTCALVGLVIHGFSAQGYLVASPSLSVASSSSNSSRSEALWVR
jgi:hypothetical protein